MHLAALIRPISPLVGGATMPTTPRPPTRFVGLDIHKHYLVAVGVDAARTVVFGPQRVAYTHLTP